MHHCGDSVSEAGSQAGKEESERETGLEREVERERALEREDKSREKKEEGGVWCITEIRSAPFSETRFNEIKRLSLSDIGKEKTERIEKTE